ncbi:MAG: hypothetical protein ACKO9V_03935, partial [Candidatus Kapaibacterium sp.]
MDFPPTRPSIRRAAVFAAMLVLYCTLGVTLYAGTPKGRILGSLTDDRDTIDFGFLMAGNDSAFVFRDLYFINDGDEALVVRDSGIDITRIGVVNAVSEFSYPAVFPLSVGVGRDASDPVRLSLRCQASTFLLDAPEGENAVRTRVRLAVPRAGRSDSTVAERTFILRFVKTVRPLWATPVVNFDTVYAGTSTFTDAVVTMRNTDIRRTLLIDDTLTRAISGSAGRFTFLQSPLAPFARDSAKPRTIGVRYSAGPGGRDSVAFGIVQYNPSVLRMGSDTTISYLCGVSVRQDVRLAAVRGRRAVRNGDTVDVGSWTVGARDSVTVT